MNKTKIHIQWLPYLTAIKPKNCSIVIKNNIIELPKNFFDEQITSWKDIKIEKS